MAAEASRRRSGATSGPGQREGRNLEKVVFFLVAGLGAVAFIVWWLLREPPKASKPIPLSQMGQVSSTVTPWGDSLEMIVAWQLGSFSASGKPDSVRVRVVPAQGDTIVVTGTSVQAADTLRLAAPPPGKTLSGYSCVAAHYRWEPTEENCTPWQYVRPAASDSAGQPRRLVVQPDGLQVDPDINGACANWQRIHPKKSVWIVVNRTAIPECTGPNHKPTVAQFCAFAVLPDGRRVKTVNSTNNPYCDELFEEWIRERYS